MRPGDAFASESARPSEGGATFALAISYSIISALFDSPPCIEDTEQSKSIS